MDRPQVERIDGIPPAIAIDQTNPVRTSRSTVGTMTELNDHLKLLFSRAAQVYCRQCSAPVKRDSAQSIYEELSERLKALGRSDARVIVTFPVPVPANFGEAEVLGLLEKQGYTRLFQRITSDRGRGRAEGKGAKKKAAKKGRKGAERRAADQRRARNDSGPLPLRQHRARARDRSARSPRCASVGIGVAIHVLEANVGARSAASTDAAPPATSATWRFSSDLHCADCDIHYQRAHAQPVLVQLAARGVRGVPGFRSHHRHRLRSASFPIKARR